MSFDQGLQEIEDLLKADSLDKSLQEIHDLLEKDKLFEASDPAKWTAQQFNPTAEPDPIYDPLAKFEAQLKAGMSTVESDAIKAGFNATDAARLSELVAADPVPGSNAEKVDRAMKEMAEERKIENLSSALDDIEAAGGRPNANPD
jgi:hypothetical protein